MPTLPLLIGFCLATFGMVLRPDPNMIYLVSRAICQGRGPEGSRDADTGPARHGSRR